MIGFVKNILKGLYSLVSSKSSAANRFLRVTHHVYVFVFLNSSLNLCTYLGEEMGPIVAFCIYIRLFGHIIQVCFSHAYAFNTSEKRWVHINRLYLTYSTSHILYVGYSYIYRGLLCYIVHDLERRCVSINIDLF